MKKKYIKPSVQVVVPQQESLMNDASVIDFNGKPQGRLGGNTTTGGTEGEGGHVWADAKENTWGSLWDE